MNKYVWRHVIGGGIFPVAALLIITLFGIFLVMPYANLFWIWFSISFLPPCIAAAVGHFFIFRHLQKGKVADMRPQRLPLAIVLASVAAVLCVALMIAGMQIANVSVNTANVPTLLALAPILYAAVGFCGVYFYSPLTR